MHGTDSTGQPVLRRKLRRAEVTRFFPEIPPCLVGIEVSGSAHYWARTLGSLGHTVRLMAPQFVKPYAKSQKNDANDAEAICEAVGRPQMRFVPQKSIEQQDLQFLYHVRSRLVVCRTHLINQIRDLLAEYGIVLAQHPGQVCRGLSAVLEDAETRASVSLTPISSAQRLISWSAIRSVQVTVATYSPGSSCANGLSYAIFHAPRRLYFGFDKQSSSPHDR